MPRSPLYTALHASQILKRLDTNMERGTLRFRKEIIPRKGGDRMCHSLIGSKRIIFSFLATNDREAPFFGVIRKGTRTHTYPLSRPLEDIAAYVMSDGQYLFSAPLSNPDLKTLLNKTTAKTQDIAKKLASDNIRNLRNRMNPLARSLLFLDDAFLKVSDINSSRVARLNYRETADVLTETLHHPDYAYISGILDHLKDDEAKVVLKKMFQLLSENRRFSLSGALYYRDRCQSLIVQLFSIAFKNRVENYGYYRAAISQLREVLELERRIAKMSAPHKRQPSSALLSSLNVMLDLTKAGQPQ